MQTFKDHTVGQHETLFIVSVFAVSQIFASLYSAKVFVQVVPYSDVTCAQG